MKIEEQLITLSKLRKSKNVIENFLEKTDKLMKSIVANYLVPNELVHFRSMSNVEIAIGKFQLWQLTGLKITHGQSSIIFPEACSLFPRWKLCTGNETIIIMAITYPSILQPYALNTQLLENRTTTQQLKLYDQNFIEYEVKDTKQPLDIIISRRAFQRLDVKQSVPALQKYNRSPKQFEEMIYHKLEIKLDSSAVFIEIRLDEVLNDSVLYFRKNLKPTLKEFDEKFIISPKKKYGRLNTDEILISNAQNKYRPGLYYIGISRLELSDYPSNVSSKNFSLQYSLLILTSNCQFFDSTLNKWLTNGCYVHSISSLQTHCKCNHLTSFARGFVIEPNEIEFTYILANAGFLDNQAIYITISTILVLYILIFIWARRKDDTDLEKIGAHPLPENNKDNVFIYEIMVITGTQKESGTDSKVQFIVYGDYNNSGIRTFENPNQEILRSGGRDAFILTTSRSLGNLNYIRIWHDNSGKGKYASWFLKALAIKDVQTNKRWIFIANRWFSMDKIPAKIDHIVPSASMEQIQQFTNRFHTLSKQSISDDHIWLSVFYRPPRSRFNRKERLSCCLVILCLSMLVSAMWYDKVPSRAISGLKLGPLTISVEQMAVGILSNIIELPLSLFIIVLFQKSRLRKLRPSRFRDTLCQIREKLGPKYIVDRKFGWIDASYQKLPSNEKISFKGAALSISFISHLKNKKTFLFPWWCRYIAWLLVLVTITTSLFLVWGYGIMFGNEKTSKWLTSLVISFFSSILLTQPIKVFVSSLMFSLLCSSFDPYQDDADDDEEPPNLLKIEDYQQYELQFPTKKKLIRMRTVDKTHQKDLREARKERRKEIKMWKISAKYISYVFYLTVLLMICYVNNDPANFYYREHLKNSFIKSGDQFNDFLKINSDVRFWNWTRNALIPELKVGPLYNGNKPYGLRGFLNDHVSRILGYAVIRQIRVKDHDGNFSKSPGFSRIFNEDREDYNLSWIGKKRNDDEYTYRTSDELSGQLSFVKLDMYGGGGYTYKLLGPVDYLKSKITTLERSKWIDKRTRAVIVEFSVYNCQSNLFGVLAIYAEMFPGGGFVPSFKINIVRLLRYHQNFGLFVLLFEIFAFVVVMYFTYREVKLIIFMKKKYFNEFWNVLEGLSLVLSYVTILLYCYRHWLTSKILKTFSNSHGNAYVKLQEVAMIDEVLNYFLAFVTFIAILKIIRLTQFSSRMNLLHETLNHLRGDLSNYSVIFFVIFASFVQLFYLIFGSSILGFSNLLSASETTGSIMLGKFDFNEINRTSPYLGPSLFFLFSIVSKFIILNLLLTLIMTAFSKVKRKFRDGDELQVMTFIWMKLALWIGLPINFKKTNNMQNETNDKKPTNSQFSVEFCEEVFEKFTHFIQQKSFEI